MTVLLVKYLIIKRFQEYDKLVCKGQR